MKINIILYLGISWLLISIVDLIALIKELNISNVFIFLIEITLGIFMILYHIVNEENKVLKKDFAILQKGVKKDE